MKSLSLIIPCFNEERNIKKLFQNLRNLQKKINIQVVIVNNGSVDETANQIKKNKVLLKNLKIVNIKKNIGFGNGIKKGLKYSKNKIVSYTHADLQTDVNDIFTAFQILENSKIDNFLVKGLRKSKRRLIDIVFTKLMTFYNLIILNYYMPDIHAQPNLFKKNSIKDIFTFPNDMSFDLALFYYAKKNNFKIMRYPVYFKKRTHGIGSNDSIVKKIIYSLKSLKSSIKILIDAK